MNGATMLLTLRLALARRGPLALAALLLCAAGVGAWLWTAAQARSQRALESKLAAPAAGPASSTVAVLAAAPDADQNLAAFYATLGERREVEQQLKALFAIAAKNNLRLNAGQYRPAYDQNGHFHTYTVTLPVKGSYRALWQFCLQSLASIPFAALDEISLRREAIGETALEARVRFTFYLKEGAQ